MNNYSYVGSGMQSVTTVDISRFIGALVEAVNQELITRAEARAWLATIAPAFAKATEPKCKCAP